MPLTRASLQVALVNNGAGLPVLGSLFIRELLRTGFAVKLLRVELLFDKAIDVFAKINSIATLWAFVASILPLSNASGTAELITLHALFGVLNDLQAYETTEVGIKGLHAFFGLQTLINVDEIALQLFNLSF